MNKLYKFLRKNWWITILLILSGSGIILSCWGFCKTQNFSDSLYDTFRLFVLNPNAMNLSLWQLQWARWVILAAFLWATFRLFFEIMAPKYITELSIRFFYRNHIIISGINEITISLAEKFENKKMVVLAEETNKYAEFLKTKNIKLLIGDLSDESFLQKAKIGKATQFYAVTEHDKKNVKTAQMVLAVLEKTHKPNKIQCFVLIKDRELKIILEDTTFFKYGTPFFDCILFNINEMGIKYGLAMHIDKILPECCNPAPEILLVGLTQKTAIILHNLAHCYTLKQEKFKFTIVEENVQKMDSFKEQYAYLQKFAEIEWGHKIKPEKQFSSILVCIDDQTEAIKRAVEIYYLLCEKTPNIVVFCNETDIFSKALMELKEKRIFQINLFEQIADYVFALDTHLEKQAKETHSFWNTLFQMQQEWDTLPGHFKQTNRNQILDNSLRCFVARGKRFDDLKNCLTSFSDEERTTLAMMEHRRWVLEKLAENWTLGERDKAHGDPYKRHHCLVDWNELTEEDKQKDYQVVDLMIKLLYTQKA